MASQQVCGKSELDLFSSPMVQVAIIDDYEVSTGPVSALSEGRGVQFHLSESADDYTDLTRAYLKVRAKITKKDGSPVTHFKGWNADTTVNTAGAFDDVGDENSVVPVNLLLHSMFSQVILLFCQLIETEDVVLLGFFYLLSGLNIYLVYISG